MTNEPPTEDGEELVEAHVAGIAPEPLERVVHADMVALLISDINTCAVLTPSTKNPQSAWRGGSGGRRWTDAPIGPAGGHSLTPVRST